MINDSINAVGAFYGSYNQDTNKVRLKNSAGTGFLGPRTPGAAGAVLDNGRVRLNVAAMTVSGSGNQLTIRWPVTFKSAFGSKSCKQYLNVKDEAGVGTWWRQVGTWSVGGASAARSIATMPPPLPPIEDEPDGKESGKVVPWPPSHQ